jgi:hypothetical protein
VEVVYNPKQQAEEDAKQEAGDKRKGDRPAAATPVEVTREAAQRDIEAVEAENHQPRHDEEKSKEDQDTAEVRHGSESESDRLACGGQHGGGFAQEIDGLAGFGEDAYVAAEATGLLAHAIEIGVEARQHDDAAGGKFAGDIADQSEAISSGHGDITEKKVGIEDAGGLERLICRVGSPGFEAALDEDERKSIGDEMIIVNDKNSLHGDLPFVHL